jgi:predicted phage terminase large subunit-like protein
MPEKDFVLHPYVMGALIGNGSLGGHSVAFTSADYETLLLVNRLLPEGHILYHKERYDYRIINTGDGRGRYHKNVVVEKLREYGLMGKRSYENFIPLPYMYASHEQRKWLLRGLMDTDGYAEAGTSIYTTTSYTLAIQVQELARSLGGYASLTRKTNCGYRDSEGAFVECRDAFNVNMCFPSDKADIFALPRKAEIYRPKRKEIKRFIKDVQYVFDDECQCIYVSDPTHLYIADDYILTHNTTIEEMFISFVMGHFPNKPNLFSSFSGFMTRMFYDAVDNFIESNEYCWSDVFPDVKMESTNAKEETINLDRWQPFKTLTCRPINASLTGNTRCEGYLCVDDLVSGIEEALSKERLDKLFNKYGTDLKTRRKVGAKEIHLATRWSVHDVIGRLQRQYEGNPRARFVAVPDIDPNTGKSNFEYDYGVGFTVKYFTDIAATMDEISYRCMFKSEPIEREGILYNADQLKRYLNLPMDDEGNVLKPDAVFSVCDTKDTGKDYNAHVCIKQYGNNYYLDDVVFKNIDPGTLDYLNADMIVRNKVQMSQFESNKEGSRTANEVERIVTEKGWFCHFTKKYTTQNKETKIIINSPWVLEHVYFKDPSLYPLQSDYANFIKFLCSWTQLGKNTHDDAPDVMAMVAIFVAEMLGGQVQVMSREDLGF